jgi:hypothetical protein
MKRLSEEMLNAYADGVLEAHTRAEVEAQLETDAEARAILEKLRRANALTIEAYAAPMREPPPQALIDTILKGPAYGASADRDAPQARHRWRAWSVRDYALPLAAALALAVGIIAGVFLGRQAGQAPEHLALGAVPADSTLSLLLERHPSGSTLKIGGSQGAAWRLSVVATFRDRHARACREVELLPQGADLHAIAAAVACRDTGGRWVVEGATRLAGAPRGTSPQFEPSGVPEKDALEGLLALLGAQQALTPAEEKALIASAWKN